MIESHDITYTERPPNGILPCCGAFVREDIPFPFHCSCNRKWDHRPCKHVGEVVRQIACKTCAQTVKMRDVFICTKHNEEACERKVVGGPVRDCFKCQDSQDGYEPLVEITHSNSIEAN